MLLSGTLGGSKALLVIDGQMHTVAVGSTVKGVTLRSSKRSTDMVHSINLAAEDLARQVKKHRDKRRGRREAHRVAQQDAA